MGDGKKWTHLRAGEPAHAPPSCAALRPMEKARHSAAKVTGLDAPSRSGVAADRDATLAVESHGTVPAHASAVA
eukprot:scaffold14521_cov121-Isochrysis_galbana.AAC.6